MPAPKSKKTLYIAIAAIVVVVAVVLAAVMVVLPKTDQSTPQASMTAYFDGVKEHDAAKVVDSTIMHLDTANRSMIISNLTSSWGTMSLDNVSIVSTEAISASNVPTDIKADVVNFTTGLQSLFSVTVQESQFLKVTIKQTNSSTDTYSTTVYTLFSKVDGKWYYDIYVTYSTEDWAADRALGDSGGFHFPGTVITTTTPTATFMAATNVTGSWHIILTSVSSSTVSYTDCEVLLTIGTHESSIISIPSSLSLIIPVSAGTATGYTLTINDFDSSGYLSAADQFTLGPFTLASGINAKQPTGTSVTLTLIYEPSGGTIGKITFAV